MVLSKKFPTFDYHTLFKRPKNLHCEIADYSIINGPGYVCAANGPLDSASSSGRSQGRLGTLRIEVCVTQ
jgi:hypothetical protein